ncbi:MAG: hypothetical protein IBX60_01690 [Candidatus Aminicenantes bacterium]|nr:hypothetical protein [Candidatus Aminicenantes bacterium]
MKKTILSFLVSLIVIFLSFEELFSQEKKFQESQLPQMTQEKIAPSYNPEGRRDPFKDLLAGRELKEKTGKEGVPQMSIDDVVLIGIVKAKGKFTAIIRGAQGFPYYLKVGNTFVDGFVLSINDSKVIFRKTNDRGVPLLRPRDITKEIKPEER